MSSTLEHQEDYDPRHKASSITSTCTNNSAPSFYSGRDSASSVCEDIDSPSLQPASFDEFHYEGTNQLLESFFDLDKDNHEPAPAVVEPTFLHSSDLHFTSLQEQQQQQLEQPLGSRKRRASETSNLTTGTTRSAATSSTAKLSRDLLTEEERRANHIASEQKRRNTIRTGFKDLTDIIPTLKNINNSKSTILFKAAEYIKHLEKRNRGLRDKLTSLQLRLEVETRLGRSFLRRRSSTAMHHHHQQHYHHRPSFSSPSSSSSYVITTTPAPVSSSCLSSSTTSTLQHVLTPEAYAALMVHRKQQKHLEMLQERLRLQQELLAAQHKLPPHYFSSAIVMPAEEEPPLMMNAPSLNIPADEDFGIESVGRERLLSCGKLKHLYPASSSSSTPSSSRH